MSTVYRTRPAIPYDTLFKNLPEGITEKIGDETTPTSRCLTNGTGHMWAYPEADGAKTEFERFGLNNGSTDILEAIADHFGVAIYSEHDDGYWDEDELEDDPGD